MSHKDDDSESATDVQMETVGTDEPDRDIIKDDKVLFNTRPSITVNPF